MSNQSSRATADAYATPALQIIQLEKVFGGKGVVTKALNGLSFSVEKGEFVSIMGPSGSGKSTLLNCIATIEKPTSGRVMVAGKQASALRGKALAKFRAKELGFIFQDANLVETLTGYENIALPLSLQGVSASKINFEVKVMAEQLDVVEVLDKLPAQMSGGQRQRVAAARAMVSRPTLVLADEPTGALDSHNATNLLNTLNAMNKEMGATILMVTHDAYAASFADRVIFIKDGKMFTEVTGKGNRKELFDSVMQVQSFLSGEVQA